MKKKLLFSAVILGGSLLYSCGGGGSSDSTTSGGGINPSSYAKILGQISNPSPASISTQDYQVGDYLLKYISAVTVEDGQVVVVSSEIDNEGRFELTLLKDKDYVFTIFDNDGSPVISTTGKTFEIRDNDFVTINLVDTDNDGSPDALDVIPSDNDSIVPVEDTDNDYMINVFEKDLDNDGIPDIQIFMKDSDGDGVPDAAEDKNGDGIPDVIQDHDKDGILDIFEDEDNDGVKDVFEHIKEYKEDKWKDRKGMFDNDMKDEDHIHRGKNILDRFPYEELSQEEESSLYTVKSEEKIAKDLYNAFNESYNQQIHIFKSLSKSEDRNLQLLELLFKKYEISDNDVPENTEVQDLYQQLLTQGLQSEESALEAAAYIEEKVINDTKEILQNVDNRDLQFVYKLILENSKKHLRSVVKLLEKEGIQYQPQILSDEDFNNSVSSHNHLNTGTDSNSVVIGGSIKEDTDISTSAFYKKYVVAYMIDNDSPVPFITPVKPNNTFSMKLPKDREYIFGIFDNDGNPIAFTEGEAYRVLDSNVVTLFIKDLDNDGIKDEIVVDPLNKEALKEEFSDYSLDIDRNGIPDALEEDMDMDGKPDYFRAFEDKDRNGVFDRLEGEKDSRQHRGRNSDNTDRDTKDNNGKHTGDMNNPFKDKDFKNNENQQHNGDMNNRDRDFGDNKDQHNKDMDNRDKQNKDRDKLDGDMNRGNKDFDRDKNFNERDRSSDRGKDRDLNQGQHNNNDMNEGRDFDNRQNRNKNSNNGFSNNQKPINDHNSQNRNSNKNTDNRMDNNQDHRDFNNRERQNNDRSYNRGNSKENRENGNNRTFRR